MNGKFIWELGPGWAFGMVSLLMLSLVVIAALIWFLIRYRKQNKDLLETRKHLHTAEEMLAKDAAIKEVKMSLERIINTAPIAFAMTIDGTIVKVNEYMQKYVGMNVGETILPFYAKPEQRKLMIEQSMKRKVTNETVSLNMKNGETHRFLANISTTEFDQKQAFFLWAADIEEREKQKDELSASRQKFREIKERLEQIIQTAPVSYMMLMNGKIVEINENMKKNSNLDIGDDIKSVFTNVEDRGNLWERLLRDKQLTNEIVRINMKNGESHRCLLNIVTAEYEKQQAILVWAIDIEKRERRKDQLEIARMNLQTIMDTMPIPVSIVDEESLMMVYGNNGYVKLFGYDTMEELKKFHVLDTLVPVQEDGTDSRKLVEDVVRSKVPVKMEMQIQKKKGSKVDVLVLTHPIDYNGRKSIVAIMTDLTAEKEYQRLLRNTAKKEKEANELKSRFLVNMSHEIRTPMNAIIGLTEIELRKNPPKEALEVYGKINNSAKILLQIINDILDLSKIEADKVELFDEEFELEEVLNNALLVASPRLDGKNVEFMLNASLDLPRFVIGDRTRLWQILKNILDNAAKYTQEGKIMVDVFHDGEKSSENEIFIQFIISDTGVGMKDEQLKKVFTPYKQFYNEIQRTYTGSGLGMPISKRLCERMGGKMAIESKPGEGTTVRIAIPFRRSGNEETGRDVVDVPKLADLNVLAVDDDDVSLRIMTTLLESNRVNCVKAHSGKEALDVIFRRRDEGKGFDLILLDYRMDGLDGLETARKIRSGLSTAPKLLMVTAYQKQLVLRELKKNGIEDVLEKPFIPSQFIHKICKTMGFEEDYVEKEETYTRFQNVTVLLCEDFALNQEVAVGMFEQFGIQSVIAKDGRQGLETLIDGDRPIDLIFMDLHMPVMDGYEATRRIRSDSRFDEIPIISLTADAMTEVVEKCREAGMDDYITKPIEFDKLHDVLIRWLPKEKRVRSIAKPVKGGLEGNVLRKSEKGDGLARFGGDKGKYEEALYEFAESLPDDWPEFEYVVGEGRGEMGQNIHKWKGAAGNLSVWDVYQCAESFERDWNERDPDIDGYERLVRACQRFKSSVKRPVSNGENTVREDGSLEEWKELARDLKEALSNFDPKESSKIVEAIRKKVWPVEEGKVLRLIELTLEYEFDAAMELLESMRQ